MRLLAAAYPGAFAAVSSMAAVGFHPHASPNHPLHPLHRHQQQHPGYPALAFPGFPYPSPTAEQIAALDCSVRNQRANLHIHHQRLLQGETSARLQAASVSTTAAASSSSSPPLSQPLPSSSSSVSAAAASMAAVSPASSSSAAVPSGSRAVLNSEMLLDSLLGPDHRKTPQLQSTGLLRASPVSSGIGASGGGLDVGPFAFLDSPEHHVKMADVLNSSGEFKHQPCNELFYRSMVSFPTTSYIFTHRKPLEKSYVYKS